jgi:hypothetical protein
MIRGCPRLEKTFFDQEVAAYLLRATSVYNFY